MSLRMRDFELQMKYRRRSMGDSLSGLYNKTDLHKQDPQAHRRKQDVSPRYDDHS